MSTTAIDKLKDSVMESKTTQERVKSALVELEKKNSGLFSSGKIDFDTYMKIGNLAHEIYKLWQERKLDTRLNEIVSAGNVLSVAPYYGLDEVIRGREWVDLIEILKDLGSSLNTLFEKPLPSVSVGTERDPEQRSKSIDNMLYSYTPFKLRGTAGRYAMSLLPSARGHNITTKWCDDDSRTFYEGDVKILTPNSIRLTSVNDLKSLISVSGERGFRLEIDRRSPDNGIIFRRVAHLSPSTVVSIEPIQPSLSTFRGTCRPC